MENIIITDTKKFEEKLEAIASDGLESLCLVSDFDRTLTKAFNEEGTFVPSMVAVLRSEGILSEEYTKESTALFEKYHPHEIDANLEIEDKKRLMETWWEKHFNLLIKSNLTKSSIEIVVKSGVLKLRDGTSELTSTLSENNVPFIIFSANVLGVESMNDLFVHYGIETNFLYITNQPVWNSEAKLESFRKPFIHSMNKDFTVSNLFDQVNEILTKKENALLLGDSLGDANMVNGHDFKNVIKVGFLNHDIKKNLEAYKKIYDVVITDDGTLDFVVDLLKSIK